MPEYFATTRWSLVAAAKGDEPRARRALGELCEAYWLPVYAYLRRRGEDAETAADWTQGLFARLLERDDLQRVAAERGRFRSWLLTCLQHYVANERRAEHRAKRGGLAVPLALDCDEAEQRLALEPGDAHTPEWHFERAWAMALLDRARGALATELEAAGKRERFEALRATLDSDPDALPYRQLADQLGTTEGSIKVFVHQLRQRFASAVRREIADTLPEGADAAMVEEEVGQLFRILGRDPG